MPEQKGTDEPDGMLASMLAIQNPSRDDPTWPWPSFDARDWAASFCEHHPGADMEVMVGWFANALMRGYDEARLRAAQEASDGQ